ncbi:MAG: hypothetical protein RIS85_1135, partial [Pseudomonadota bacterium]
MLYQLSYTPVLGTPLRGLTRGMQ